MGNETVTEATYPIDGRLGVDFTSTSTTAEFELGDRLDASDGATYEYVQASSAVAAYAFVKIDNDHTAAELTTAISGSEPTRVGCAQVAIAASSYGWVVVKGPFSGLLAASCAADVKIGTTTTAGVLDDTYTDLVQGVKAVSANGGAQAATSCFASTFMVTNAQD